MRMRHISIGSDEPKPSPSSPWSVALLALLLCVAPVCPAQSATTQNPIAQETNAEREAARKRLEAGALKLLDETIADAAAFRLAENRALVQAMAGDLLWNRDERRARSLMQDALANFAQIKTVGDRKRGRDDWMIHQTRQNILTVVARRDPQAALDALRQSRVGDGTEGEDARADSDAGFMEQQLISQIAANDPALALRVAEENLKKGVSFDIINSVVTLQHKSPEAADKLVAAVIDRLRTSPPTNNNLQMIFAAAHLARMGAQADGAVLMAGAGLDSEMKPPLPIGEERRRELVQIIADAAASAPAGSPVLYAVQEMIPDVQKYAPARAEMLRRRVAQFEQTQDPQSRAWREASALLRAGDIDALLEAAPRMPSEVRRSMYGAASFKLLEKGEAERARQIVESNVRDADERREMLAALDAQIAARFVAAGKINEARKALARTQDKERRAAGLANLASAALKQKDEKLARNMLDEAYELVRGEAGSDEEVMAQLQVAGVYTFVNPARSFEIIDALVDRANEMLKAASILDKFGGGPAGLFRSGEVVLTSPHVNANSVFGRYLKEIGALARADFARAGSSLAAFDRAELRALARLLLARGILADDKEIEASAARQNFASAGF